ncbi:N6-adenosine-methyltransferase non-catalytic subunit, partial [Geodia barretti]
MVGKEKERPRERSSRYDYHRRHSSRSRDVGSSHDQQQAKPLSKDVSFQPPASLPDEVQYIRRQRLLLRTLRRRSGLRRKLLAKEFGTSDISTIVSSRRENDENRRLRYRLNPTKYRATSRHEPPSSRKERERGRKRDDQDIEEEEATYKDSNIFMKGTQSANPHNDYSQHFVDTCQRPQNFIRDVGIGERFREYPKLRELMRLKDGQIKQGAAQPMYLQTDLKSFDLSGLGVKFDVMLVEPPLEEYQRRASGVNFSWSPWEWEEIMSLKLEDFGAQRSFLFLWCGSCEGLDLGRECLKKWGYRRCEDICWVKTNTKNPSNNQHIEQKSILQNTKEHCLMGIKGTVRRNQDGHFIHANIDLDIIITEETPIGR